MQALSLKSGKKKHENLETPPVRPDIARTHRPVGVPVFPRDPFKRSLTIAESIEKNNAGKPYDRLDLAKSLNWSPNSSGFRQLLASSSRYTLTTGSHAADKIVLTPLGSSIVAPTSEEQRSNALREALLKPDLFRKIAEFYDRKMLPKEELLKNTLRKEFAVIPEDIEQCHDVLMQNLREYGLIQNIKGNEFLQLDKLGVSTTISSQQEPLDDALGAGSPSIDDNQSDAMKALPAASQKPRVFISHSDNRKILDQVKQMLEFGGFEWEIAVDRETTAIPIPEKVFGLMRSCNCAVINVSADEKEKREGDTYGINQNVLIEIGAAFLQYEKRVILLVDTRVQLPSNLQGLNALYYQGNELSWETGMRLQKALTEFRAGVMS